MPAGCDFICNNEECEQTGNGFVITGPWPMAEIERVISKLSKNAAFRPTNREVLEKIINQKNNGRKYACIVYPCDGDVARAAYRIQLWSPQAHCIWNYDIEAEDKTLETAIEDAELPIFCPKTNGPMLNFSEVTKEGIKCPFCGEKLKQSRWFTNEDDEYEEN